MKNVPYRTVYLNTSPIGHGIWQVMKRLGNGALLEEVGHFKGPLAACFTLLLAHSVCLLCAIEDVLSQIPALASCCWAFPTIRDSRFRTIIQNKFFHELLWSWSFIAAVG